METKRESINGVPLLTVETGAGCYETNFSLPLCCLCCAAVFLDVAQAFDKVWHTGLLYKTKNTFPSPYYLLLKSERHFQIKYNNSYSDCYQVKSGVPEGSVIGPLLYLICTADLLTTNNTTIAAFADGKVQILALNI
jgi:hypothetical protein